MDISKLRKEYQLSHIDFNTDEDNPIRFFEAWFQYAHQNIADEANAMHLSTVSQDGKPSGRIVLLKEVTESGFIFFTNYKSNKGKDLKMNPWAALTFFWSSLERQVRIEGIVDKTSKAASEIYFNSRPRGSQISAFISPQSEIIENKKILEVQANELEKMYSGRAIPVPENWGGYIVCPLRVEFWQGRPNRLHDRLVFVRESIQNDWKKFCLAP